MMIRARLILPSFGLFALACGSDPAVTPDDGSSSTGNDDDDEDSSGQTEDPTTETTADPDSSSTTTEDPTTTADPDSSSTTGEPLLCGNGDLDDGEECDDENTMDGDECSATCTVPYEVVWTASHNGSASSFDSIADLAIGPDGNIYAVGAERVTDEGENLWLRQYMPDGTEGWTVSFNGLFGDDSGAGLAFYDNGDIAVVGISESEFDGEDIFLARVSGEDQSIVWEASQDGPGMGPGENDDFDFGTDVAVDGEDIVITGGVRIGVQDWDVFVGRYDGDGIELWTQTYAGAAGGDDRGRGVVVDGEGNAWVAASEVDAQDERIGFVLGYDVDGMPLDGETVALDFVPTAMGADADGNVVLVGTRTSLETFADIVVSKYDATWSEAWSVTIDRGSDEYGFGLGIGAEGNIYATGAARVAAPQVDAYVAALDQDGNRLWAATYGNTEAELDDDFTAAVEMPDGNVVAGGSERVLGEQSNAFLMMIDPL
jgi:cysteine-rich repeat protein